MHGWKFIHRKQMSGAFCSQSKGEAEAEGGGEEGEDGGEREEEEEEGALRDSTNQWRCGCYNNLCSNYLLQKVHVDS